MADEVVPLRWVLLFLLLALGAGAGAVVLLGGLTGGSGLLVPGLH
ncbi:hypothetical protein [Halomarina ordinaria]|uniref:Uncharacterized protein n=1 Tax=Halomarina ordinaria TaxID=3033939 RepID=A0ABD5UDP7_9EURY|nr:hypothetical protein [Halomarina sp. PSRA2]